MRSSSSKLWAIPSDFSARPPDPRPVGGSARRSSAAALAILMVIVPLLPAVAADGMPMYAEADFEGDDPDEAFTSIFESRQLAEVELLNDTHERINLFL
jgi:hypothetical protein